LLDRHLAMASKRGGGLPDRLLQRRKAAPIAVLLDERQMQAFGRIGPGR
jgi:hypothetical protein